MIDRRLVSIHWRSTFFGLVAALVLSGCPSEKAPPPAKAPPKQPVAAAPSATTNPSSAPGANTAAGGIDGAALYAKGCANCHGMDGTGSAMRKMLPNVGDLTSAEMHTRMSDEMLANHIAKGKGKMPPFEKIFKPEEIAAIIKHVRTLKK